MLKSKSESIAIIDMASSSVGVAIVNWSKARDQLGVGCLNFQYLNRYKFDLSSTDLGFSHLLKLNEQALNQALQALKKSNLSFKRVFVFWSSSFYVDKTKLVRIEKTTGQVVTRHWLKSTLNDLEKDFVNQRQRKDYGFKIFESLIMQVKLNGYPSTSWLNKKANSIEIAIRLAGTDNRVVNNTNQIINGQLGHKNITHHTSLATNFMVWRDLLPHKKSFMVLDTTGELTDLAVVNNNYIKETLSFPWGHNRLIKTIAQKNQTSIDATISLLQTYQRQALDTNQRQKLNNLLTQIKTEWLNEVSKSFQAVMNTNLLPQTVYLIGEDLTTEVFSFWLKDEVLSAFSLTHKPLEVVVATSDLLRPYCLNQDRIPDQPMVLMALFCQKNI